MKPTNKPSERLGDDDPAGTPPESPAEQTLTMRPVRDDDTRPAADPPGEGEANDEAGAVREDTEPVDTEPVDEVEDEPVASSPKEAKPRKTAEDSADEPAAKAKTFDAFARTREVDMPDEIAQALTAALNELKESVSDLRFGLDTPGSEEADRARAEILAQLDDYVIPRVRLSTAPALIVVAGSTGAGKSTIVNTLADANVSATGVRRPTTSTPVLVCHPEDRDWFGEGKLLGGLRQVEGDATEDIPGGLIVAESDRLPTGIALLDSPDIDSVVESHHQVAYRMLDAADMWIFVTSAARYADAPAWRLLRLAKERGSRLAIVLSRVPPRSRDVVVKHFVRMLTEYGLGEVDRFVIDECATRGGMLPDGQITELRLWLTELSVDDERRARAVRETLAGVLDGFRTRVPALARHLETQVALRGALRSDVEAAYAAALAAVDEATRNGSLLRGEVLARWQDFAGSGDILRALQLRRPGRGRSSRQPPERQRALKSALRAALEAVVLTAAQRAAEEVVARWTSRGRPGDTLAATPGFDQISEDMARRVGRSIGAWQDHMVELMRREGSTKRSVAKVLSVDEESLALIFSVGLLGYGMQETGDGQSLSLPQRLLRALIGAESLRNISIKARNDLRARIGMLFDEETMRYVQALDGAGIPDESAAARLYQATYNLEVAR